MTAGTLVYIFQGPNVLLGLKKRGFGAANWNAPGGKIELGETAKITAIRETQEEVGLTPALTEPIGEILYHDPMHGNWKVTVYRTESYSGELIESDEMKPQWWPVDTIPYKSMWEGDEEWLPHVIENKNFTAELWFNNKGKLDKFDVRLGKSR